MVDTTEAQVYTVPQVCRILKLSRNTVYTQIAQGKIPVLRFGKVLRVSKIELDRMLNGEGNSEAKNGEL